MWTNISKPSGGTWTSLTFDGKYIWDDPNVNYDDPNVYWDGADPMAFTKVAKPSGARFISAGMATGLLMPLTYSINLNSGTPWVKVSKPN